MTVKSDIYRAITTPDQVQIYIDVYVREFYQ
jgi:hypothetical protein